MKKSLLLSAVVALGMIPTAVSAQNQTIYSEQQCYQTVEEYVPGRYNEYGTYIGGFVRANRYRVPCNNVSSYRNYDDRGYRGERDRRICNPTAGAALGAGLASALTGNSYNYGGSYYRNYNSNGYSGGYNNYGRNSNGWTLFGAGLGALIYSC